MPMKNWEKFEFSVAEHLNKIYKESEVSFISQGGSNSNIPDIAIKKGKKDLFNMECKYDSSQAGQFVVRNNECAKEFVDSHLNKGNQSRRQKIINHMNKEYDYYSSSNKSIELRCSKQLMIDAIIEHYKSKNVLFFASSHFHSNFSKNFLKIIKINDVGNQFDISGVYRKKRSGSRDLPIRELKDFKNIISKDYVDFEIETIDKQTFLRLDSEPKSLYVANKTYYLSPISNNKFRIKKRSNTVNSNIIFTMKFNPNNNEDGLKNLDKEIKTFK